MSNASLFANILLRTAVNVAEAQRKRAEAEQTLRDFEHVVTAMSNVSTPAPAPSNTAERAVRAARLRKHLSMMNQMTLSEICTILEIDPKSSKEVVAFELDMSVFDLGMVTKRERSSRY